LRVFLAEENPGKVLQERNFRVFFEDIFFHRETEKSYL